jgi:hypothetical protein
MKETRLEYKDSWKEAAREVVRVRGTPVLAWASAATLERFLRYLMMVAFMANLMKSRGTNQTMFWKGE